MDKRPNGQMDKNISSWFSEAQEIRLINSKDKYIGKVEDKANVVYHFK